MNLIEPVKRINGLSHGRLKEIKSNFFGYEIFERRATTDKGLTLYNSFYKVVMDKKLQYPI